MVSAEEELAMLKSQIKEKNDLYKNMRKKMNEIVPEICPFCGLNNRTNPKSNKSTHPLGSSQVGLWNYLYSVHILCECGGERSYSFVRSEGWTHDSKNKDKLDVIETAAQVERERRTGVILAQFAKEIVEHVDEHTTVNAQSGLQDLTTEIDNKLNIIDILKEMVGELKGIQ